MPTEIIFALDIAIHTGFAVGSAGALPRSGVVTLKKRGETRDVAFYNMRKFLENEWKAARPTLVVKEAPFMLGAFGRRSNSQETVMLAYGLHAQAESMAYEYGIRCEQAPAQTIRKHFIGRANMGSREETKLAVVKRCHLLGLMPKDRFDDNRADACAVWDWACAKYVRKSVTGKTLYLWGETHAERPIRAP